MRRKGFTLIELLVVLAIVATLLTLVWPRYFASIERAKESVLRTDLRVMREAIDRHLADTGRYPSSLDSLVERRYLHSIPIDPITERADTWIVLLPGQTPADASGRGAEVFDIRSGAAGSASDGSTYADW